MGHGFLNVWVRRRNCIVFTEHPTNINIWNCYNKPLPECTVEISYDQGKTWEHQRISFNIPTKSGHILMKVPPGCYIVEGYCRDLGKKCDPTIVVVGCGTTACVNLIIAPYESVVMALTALRVNALRADVKIPLEPIIKAMEVVPEEERLLLSPDVGYCIYHTIDDDSQKIIIEHFKLLTGEAFNPKKAEEYRSEMTR